MGGAYKFRDLVLKKVHSEEKEKSPIFIRFFGMQYSVGDRDLKTEMKAFISVKLYKNPSVSKHQEARDTELNFYTICNNESIQKPPEHAVETVLSI